MQISKRELILTILLCVSATGLILMPIYFISNPRNTTSTWTTVQLTTTTASVTSVSAFIVLSVTTVTSGQSVTTPQLPPQSPYQLSPNNPGCNYPFNPYLCNEGPPTTVIGTLYNDTGCVQLVTGGQVTYVVANLPSNSSAFNGQVVQVYGFIYPDWSHVMGTQQFPPYPFQTTICVGTPLWAIYPYTQAI